ncbi:unnamed protein product [Darwinula stevensoni]|uniref:Lens epithelium-derived growth factor integrase-binding domain-containing protein n=1 Tax=Darwinula stevensoni TaxID=69355 RepID=A0A7R9AH45_9CRUS|nr:unnamed protein product [Darwinula stevensoni]CAG0905077.1 unnamed protein product [Darwinula stevensoni]
MLIKHPAIVHCIRKLREVKHNGVRKKSEDLYKQFKKLFVIPDGKQFVDVFQEKVKAFQEATKDMDVAKRFLVIRDPTLPREKAQIPYDSESEDDFDGFGNRGDEKLRQEKRSQEKEKNRGKEGEKKKDREREGKSGKEKKPKDETEKKPVQAKPEH